MNECLNPPVDVKEAVISLKGVFGVFDQKQFAGSLVFSEMNTDEVLVITPAGYPPERRGGAVSGAGVAFAIAVEDVVADAVDVVATCGRLACLELVEVVEFAEAGFVLVAEMIFVVVAVSATAFFLLGPAARFRASFILATVRGPTNPYPEFALPEFAMPSRSWNFLTAISVALPK